MKKLLFIFFSFSFLFTCAQNNFTSSIDSCNEFVIGPNSTWTHVLVATTIAEGASSQAAQTFTMNVTSLPAGGANVRVYKTTANGNDFFGNPVALTLGSNSITVPAVTFDRAVKFQFSSGDVEFDALSLNGVDTECVVPLPPPPFTLISDCDDFVSGPSAWPYVLIATTIADGASSQAAQTFTMNVTSLPTGGANVRVYKTTANGNDFFGNPVALTLGSNSITVPAVTFDRAVKFQFSSGDVEFDALSLNGVDTECVVPLPPPPFTLISDCDDFVSGPSAWPYVLIATTIADGASSQAAQTFTMNVTSLPTGGANVRVYKTTANGNDFFGNPVALTLGSNSITVPAVTFDRAVKFQFSSGDVEFDALSLNGVDTECVCISTSSIDLVQACDNYTWIDGNTYTTSNDTATYTLVSASGCDSIVTLDLTIASSLFGVEVVESCDSYTWIDGNTYTTSNNTATFILVSSSGCDSIVTLDLTITSSSSGIDIIEACDSYTWIDGNTYTTSNNTATYTLVSSSGCDSIVTLDLTITSSSSGIDIIEACDSYTWIDGNTYATSNNTATYTIANTFGCDSIVTLDLTITTVDASVMVMSDSSLQAQLLDAGTTYQWVDCNNNFAVISGETNSIFSTQTSGDYAVEVTINDCSALSDCYNLYNNVNVDVYNTNYPIQLFPNPTKNDLTVSLKGVKYVDIIIFDIHGKVMLQQSSLVNRDNINLSSLAAGTYFVKTISSEESKVIRISKY